MEAISNYAVIDRMNGDDEMTVHTVTATSKDDAITRYKQEMCIDNGLSADETAQAMDDDPPEYLEIYVDAVLRSDSPIEEV